MLSKDNGSAAIARDKKKIGRANMNENKIGSGKVVKKNLNREVLIRDGRVTGNKQFFFRPRRCQGSKLGKKARCTRAPS